MSSSMSRRECLRVLGLPGESSPEDIKQAYRTKAKNCHPDKNPDDPDATARFQRISQAYQILQQDFRGLSRDDSDGDDDVFSFMDFFFVLQQQVREERRRREEMRRREALYDVLFGSLFSPRMRSYDDEDEFLFGSRFRQGYRSSNSWERRGERAQESTNRSTTGGGSGRYKQSRSQVHTPPSGRQRRDRQPSSPSASPSQHSRRTHQPRQTPSPSPGKSPGPRWSQTGAAGRETPRKDGGDARDPNDGSHRTSASGQDKPVRQKPKTAPAFVLPKPETMTKKQLRAQQSRRQREAREIGKELRAKSEANQRLREEMKRKSQAD